MSGDDESQLTTSGGGAKYALIGLLLLGGAGGIWFLTRAEEPAPTVEETPASAEPTQRSTALAQNEFVIPEEPEDAGVDTGAGESAAPKKRRRSASRMSSCQGEIPAAAAQRVISGQRRQVRACYERQLKANNTLQGSAIVRVRIGGSGSVQGVQVSGSLQDPTVFSCIRNLATAWVFPAPTGGQCAVLDAPFSFTPRF